MSLTSLIHEPDVRARFRAEFPSPVRGNPPALLAPVIARNPKLVGTAFDYLLRARIRRANPDAIAREWVAERAIEDLSGRNLYLGVGRLARAERLFKDYSRTGRVSSELFRSAIDLARLDLVVRANDGERYLRDSHHPLDTRDLARLLEIVPGELLRPAKVVVLNPTFGSASEMVGGADADLLLGDTLVEIKTIVDPFPSRDHFNQLVGYALLASLGGIEGAPRGHKLRSIAFYSSRYGQLMTMPLKSILPRNAEALFLWFKGRAREHVREMDCAE